MQSIVTASPPMELETLFATHSLTQVFRGSVEDSFRTVLLVAFIVNCKVLWKLSKT